MSEQCDCINSRFSKHRKSKCLLRNMAKGLAPPAKKKPANPDNLTVNSAGRVEELVGECVCSPAKVYEHKDGRCRGVQIKRRIRNDQLRKQRAEQSDATSDTASEFWDEEVSFHTAETSGDSADPKQPPEPYMMDAIDEEEAKHFGYVSENEDEHLIATPVLPRGEQGTRTEAPEGVREEQNLPAVEEWESVPEDYARAEAAVLKPSADEEDGVLLASSYIVCHAEESNGKAESKVSSGEVNGHSSTPFRSEAAPIRSTLPIWGMSVNNAVVAQPAREPYNEHVNKELADIPELSTEQGLRTDSPPPMRLSDLSISPPTVVSTSTTTTAGSSLLQSSTMRRYFSDLLDGTPIPAGPGALVTANMPAVAMSDTTQPQAPLSSMQGFQAPVAEQAARLPSPVPDYADLMAGLDQEVELGEDFQEDDDETGSGLEYHSARVEDLAL